MKGFLLLSLVAVGQCMPHQDEVTIIHRTSQSPEAYPMCAQCINVVADLKKALLKSQLQNKLLYILKTKVCPLYPGKQGKDCIYIVTTYGNKLFEAIEYLDPSVFCYIFGLCKHMDPKDYPMVTGLQDTGVASSPMLVKSAQHPDRHVYCEACMLITKLTMSAMTSNVTEEGLSHLLGPACYALPAQIQVECKSFLHQYEPIIVNMVVKKLISPQQLCGFLSFCPAESNTLKVD